jgi:hypothetical protein
MTVFGVDETLQEIEILETIVLALTAPEAKLIAIPEASGKLMFKVQNPQGGERLRRREATMIAEAIDGDGLQAALTANMRSRIKVLRREVRARVDDILEGASHD